MHPQSMGYLLAASLESRLPVLLRETNLIDHWCLYWITKHDSQALGLWFVTTAEPVIARYFVGLIARRVSQVFTL